MFLSQNIWLAISLPDFGVETACGLRIVDRNVVIIASLSFLFLKTMLAKRDRGQTYEFYVQRFDIEMMGMLTFGLAIVCHYESLRLDYWILILGPFSTTTLKQFRDHLGAICSFRLVICAA